MQEPQISTLSPAIRLNAFAGTVAFSLVVSLATGRWYPMTLLFLAAPVAAWARKPRPDLLWTIGLAIGGSFALTLLGAPKAFLNVLMTEPQLLLRVIASSSWVIAAFALGFLAGVRVFQKMRRYSVSDRHQHAMGDDHRHA